MNALTPYGWDYVSMTNSTGAYYIGYDPKLMSIDVTGKADQVEYHPSAGAGGELKQAPDTYYEATDY